MPEITIRGINGAGDQVFKGETDADLVVKLAKAQEHATRLIRKQAKKIDKLQDLLENAVAMMVTDKIAGRSGAVSLS